MLHMLFYFFNKVLHRKTKPNNKSQPSLRGEGGKVRWIFCTTNGDEKGGEKGKKKSDNAIRDDSSHSPIYMMGVEIYIFINFPNFPKKEY
jgi:hypothetical protein